MNRTLFFLALCFIPYYAGAATYKWVDEKGITHYGDTIPPQYKDRGNSELSKQGLTIKKTDPALTEEQRKARYNEEAKQKAEEQKLIEQRRRDQALLSTYTSEGEIDAKRDRDLKFIELSIANAQASLKSLITRLDEQKKREYALMKNNKPVPEALLDDIAKLKAEKQHTEGLINLKQQEMANIREKYADYKRRFNELHGNTNAATSAVSKK